MFYANLTFDKTLISDVILLYFSAKIATFWAINVFKTQLEYFCAKLLPIYSSMLVHIQLTVTQYTFIAKKWQICRKDSKIASLMSCQRSDLRKTLKYSQSWTPV